MVLGCGLGLRRVGPDGEHVPHRDVEVLPVAPGALRADPHVLDHVVARLGGVLGEGVGAVGDLACHLEGPRAAQGADQHGKMLLHRAGEREQPGVVVELAVEGQRSGVEEGAHHLVGLLHPRHGLHARPVHPVLGEQAEVPDGDDALGPAAGQLVERGHRLGHQGRLTQRDRGQAGTHSDLLGHRRRRGEQHVQVLVPGLVGGVTPVEAEVVSHPDVFHRTPVAGSRAVSRN